MIWATPVKPPIVRSLDWKNQLKATAYTAEARVTTTKIRSTPRNFCTMVCRFSFPARRPYSSAICLSSLSSSRTSAPAAGMARQR